MKHIFKLFIILAGAFIISSCSKDLNVVQVSEFTSLSMWTSPSDAAGAVNGAYSQLRAALSTSLAEYGDYRSNLYGGGMMSVVDYDKMAANVITRDMTGTDWSALYTVINDCNLVLKHTPEIEFTVESEKNQILADAYFIRAYCYFLIARVWGDAPLLVSGFESDKQEDLYPERVAAANVYAQVEADIAEAERLIPASVTNIYKATPAGINMLKADYFLWKAKVLNGGNAALTTAQTAINAVLNSRHALVPAFANVFGVPNEGNNEIIFAFNYQMNEYTGGYPSYYLAPEQYVEDKSLINNPIPIGSHQQYVCVTPDYADFIKANPNDTRAAVTIGECVDLSTNWRWIAKFQGEWTSATRYFSSDIILYRYAEAILMKAEVENALGNTQGAIDALKPLLQRAYGDQTVYNGYNKADLDNAIIDEYLKEFVSECKSWWVYVRFGVAFERVVHLQGKENVKNILLWPVSSSCINTNPKIKQTEGYN